MEGSPVLDTFWLGVAGDGQEGSTLGGRGYPRVRLLALYRHYLRMLKTSVYYYR